MNFTFGIITGGGCEQNIQKIIESIRAQNIPNYEIIIVGNCNVVGLDIINVPFNENEKPLWITKKKNMIAQMAKFENIVFLHDYIVFEPGWYSGQLIAGNDFNIRMDKIINYDGTRFRDWCIWPHNSNRMDQIIGRDCLLPYDLIHLSKYMYISGSYWIAKKCIMLEQPLDENLCWGQGEDVSWSMLIREKYDFNMNTQSTVKLLKYKDPVFFVPNNEKINILKTII